MKILLKSIMALLALVLVIGCAPTADNTHAGDGTAYIESLMKTYGKNTIQLDLSDAKQYEYIKNAYLEAGQTEANSPELYADLEKSREAGAIDAENVSREVITTTEDYYEDRAFMVSTVYTLNNRFYTSLTSTVKDGTVKTTMRFRITDMRTKKVLTTGPSGWIIKNELAGGKCVTLTADFPLPTTNKWTVLKIEGIEQININGIIYNSSTIVKSLVGYMFDSNMEKIVIQEPRDINKDGRITIGVGRPFIDGATCTYSSIEYPFNPLDGYNRVRIPLKGAFQVPYPLESSQIDKNGTYIKLVGAAYGGTTEMMYNGVVGQTFKDALSLSLAPNNGRLIQWNIPRTNGIFVNTAWQDFIAFRPASRVDWYMNFTFTNVELMPGWVESSLVYCASSDSNASNLLPDDDYPPYISFCWSCVAEGSVITMADGTFLPIEKVKAGDKVRGKRMDLTVITISCGEETKPVIRIVDEDTHNLLVTDTHPILTKNRGMIAATQLKVGDMIITEKGARKVMYIGTEMFKGKVYNLELGNVEEKARMKKMDNMYYADGILVGDLVMQMDAEAQMER